MVAVGVSMRTFSGASLPIRPERYAIVPREIWATRSNFPSGGENWKLRRTRWLPGPMEREESSRRMTPIDPSRPVTEGVPDH